MNATYQHESPIHDLAAHWTEPVVELLLAGGLTDLTVGSEVGTWRALVAGLRNELRRQRSQQWSVSYASMMERALLGATAYLARTHDLPLTPDDLVRRVQRLVRTRRPSLAELESFAALVEGSETFDLSRTSGFVPSLATVGA